MLLGLWCLFAGSLPFVVFPFHGPVTTKSPGAFSLPATADATVNYNARYSVSARFTSDLTPIQASIANPMNGNAMM